MNNQLIELELNCLKMWFLDCVCVYVCALGQWAKFTFGPLQQRPFKIDSSNFQYIFINLGVIIAQIWLLCSDWLCLFRSRCRDPHTCFLQKCLSLSCSIFHNIKSFNIPLSVDTLMHLVTNAAEF